MERPFGLELFKEKIMFISKEEKDLMHKRLDGYAKTMKEALIDITVLKAKVKILEDKLGKAKKPKTPEQIERQRQHQRAYNERQKIKRLTEKLQKLQQGMTNVSA